MYFFNENLAFFYFRLLNDYMECCIVRFWPYPVSLHTNVRINCLYHCLLGSFGYNVNAIKEYAYIL